MGTNDNDARTDNPQDSLNHRLEDRYDHKYRTEIGLARKPSGTDMTRRNV